MPERGGYWADDGGDRNHCYKIIPKDIASKRREMTLHGFDRVYCVLGALGYRFRDAGHNDQYVIVSLNKNILPIHLIQLEDAFSIEDNDGTELAFM